jgi:peroxiredoxin
VVFPGPKGHLDDFTRSARNLAENAAVPFRLLLDPDFKAVDQLSIRGELAKPSTYILDKQGQVRFAYVGASLSDRPSLKAMLAQLDQINAGG